MIRRTSLSLLALLLSSQSLAGCIGRWESPSDPPIPSPPIFREPDPDGPATFGFTLSRGCSPFVNGQCPAERPLMVGVREQVSFSIPSGWSNEEPTVSTSDATVVAVDPVRRLSADGGRFTGTFDVRAGNAGRATVTILGASGRAWQYVLRVEEAAGMDLVEDEGTSQFDREDGRLRLRVGQRVSMNGYPVSRDVERLYANDQVIWSVPSARVVNLSWSFMQGARVADDHVYVEGVAPGTDAITVRAGVVERTVLVDVTR